MYASENIRFFGCSSYADDRKLIYNKDYAMVGTFTVRKQTVSTCRFHFSDMVDTLHPGLTLFAEMSVFPAPLGQ